MKNATAIFKTNAGIAVRNKLRPIMFAKKKTNRGHRRNRNGAKHH